MAQGKKSHDQAFVPSSLQKRDLGEAVIVRLNGSKGRLAGPFGITLVERGCMMVENGSLGRQPTDCESGDEVSFHAGSVYLKEETRMVEAICYHKHGLSARAQAEDGEIQVFMFANMGASSP